MASIEVTGVNQCDSYDPCYLDIDDQKESNNFTSTFFKEYVTAETFSEKKSEDFWQKRLGSVAKILVDRGMYDYDSPWDVVYPIEGSGSGFLIEGDRILTNAHVAADALFLQVQLGQEIREAYVENIDPDCDLAILRLKKEDPTLFEDLIPFNISEKGSLPGDKVQVYGFPWGGEFTITEGITSNLEVGRYLQGDKDLLINGLDGNVAPGNSGGPVISKSSGDVVGIAFQASTYLNINEMIPSSIVNHFLQDVNSGKYEGFPLTGASTQPMNNPAIRDYYKLSSDQTGVLITKAPENSFICGRLFPGDVILSIEGLQVSNNGYTQFNEWLWTPITALFAQKFYGDTIDVKVLRDGVELELSIYLDETRKPLNLVKDSDFGKPSYFIKGGLVFQSLTRGYVEFMDEWGENLPDQLDYLTKYGQVTDEREEAVFLSRTFPDSINVECSETVNQVVKKINGMPVRSMKHLVDLIESNEAPFLVITFEEGAQIVLDSEELKERNESILNKYQLPADRSPDLRKH